jgi:hypothetical protein
MLRAVSWVLQFCCYVECNYAKCQYVKCHYATCHYAECRGVNAAASPKDSSHHFLR